MSKPRGAAALAAVVAAVWLVYIVPLPHYDIEVFLRAGGAVRHGRDPYPPPGSAEISSGFAYVYPYLVAFGFVPLSWLGRYGALAFIALSVAALIAAAHLAGAREARTYALVVMASCTITGLQMGTLNAVLFLGLAALWRCRDRPVSAGMIAAAVIYAKLFLAPVWLWLVLTRRATASAVAAVVVTVLFALAELISPVGTRAYLGMLTVLSRTEAPMGLSLTGLLVNSGLGFTVASWIARVAALGLLTACWLRMRHTADERTLYAGTLAAALVASPIIWSHYLLLLVAPLLVIAPAPDASGPRPPLVIFAVASWFVVTPHRSGPAAFAVGGVLLTLLAAPVLGTVGTGLARRATAMARTVSASPGPARQAVLASTFSPVIRTVATGALAVACGAALQLLAAAHGGSGRVIGAYCALLGMVAVACLPPRPAHGADSSVTTAADRRTSRRHSRTVVTRAFAAADRHRRDDTGQDST
ncbi:glycosyltransferase 87 family protein [Frankia sp. CiP3]|uniref:glycosyltransferase 87 family protein n=1 Tax=Frankia sp. CiP3 TaxID=2880971 RepID=UPI001EF72BEB|nr:glycosyltransferase 87 family protein [Frankia sp. CiP3]